MKLNRCWNCISEKEPMPVTCDLCKKNNNLFADKFKKPPQRAFNSVKDLFGTLFEGPKR